MSVPNCNFEGNFSISVFGKSFWHYRELKSDCRISRQLLCKKKKKKSNVSNLEFLSKSEIYMILTFSRSLCTNMLIRNDFFVFTYTGKWKKFPYFHYFYWNPGKRFTFKCSPLMTSMIFHSRSLTLKKKPVTYLVIMFQLMYIFSHVEELKITFSTSLHFDTRIM